MAGRPIGVMMGIGTALNPFTVRPSYKQIESLPIEEQRRRLRDPEMRRKILAERPSDAEIAKLAQFRQLVTTRFDKFFTMGNPPDYEPGPEKSVAAIREGRTPDEVAYDYMLEDGQYLYFPVVNYVTGDHEPIREMLNDPACLLGLSDGGAHCTSIIDAGVPSYMLTHWGRDRTRGPKLPLEMLVKRQTSETADFFGLTDRGRLAPGLRADVNLIDFERHAHAEARADPRHAGERPALRAARHGLRGDACRGAADLRARRAYRRTARQARARRARSRGLGGRIATFGR